jgi:hypothetical protein
MTSGSSPPPPADERTSAAPEAAARVTIAQVAASALAAVTATVTLSWLGSVGTIVGAAIASVVTVVGNAVYTRSIRHTQDRVLTLRQTILPPASGSVPSTASPTVPHPEPATEFSPTPGATRLQRPWLWPRLVARYGRTRMLVAVTVLLFVGILATVTVVELAAGKPAVRPAPRPPGYRHQPVRWRHQWWLTQPPPDPDGHHQQHRQQPRVNRITAADDTYRIDPVTHRIGAVTDVGYPERQQRLHTVSHRGDLTLNRPGDCSEVALRRVSPSAICAAAF